MSENKNAKTEENEELETEVVEETETEEQQPETEEKEDNQLAKLKQEFDALGDKYVRLVAEYDNFRKRSQREKESIYPDATVAAVNNFLAVADNFERALAVECADESYKKGYEMTYQSLVDAMAKLKVESFGAVGDKFDPNTHNAVMHIEDSEVDAETIVEVFQKGYRLGDRIIRHAMVKVAN